MLGIIGSLLTASGKTRNWDPIRVVCLNPEYDNASSKSKAKNA